MTVPEQSRVSAHAGDGTSLTFSFPFRIAAASGLTVTLRAADGTDSVLMAGSDYTVSGVGEAAGGSVTLTGTPPASGESVILQGVTALASTLDLEQAGAFPSQAMEEAIDHVTRIAQEQQDVLDRAVLFPVAETGNMASLPGKAKRAGKVLGFSADGASLAVGGSLDLLDTLIASALGSVGVADTGWVSTHAALSALEKPASTVPMVVLGGAAIGDGGGGLFVWDPASTATPDGGSVLQADSLGEGRWVRQDNPVAAEKVTIAQDTAEAALLRAAPRLTLDRFHFKLAQMIEEDTGYVSILAHGDSVGQEIWPVEGLRELARRYGIRGFGPGMALARHPAHQISSNLFGSQNTGADTVTDRFDVNPTGIMYRLDAANEIWRFFPHRVTGSPYHLAINRATFLYAREPGGGEFEIGYQYSLRDQNNKVDVVLDTIDTDHTSTDVQSYVIDLPVKDVNVDVFVRHVSGTSLIAPPVVEDTDASGILFTGLVKGGLAMDEQASATPAAVWARYLEQMRPDLITHSFKDSGDMPTILAAHRSLIDTATTTAGIDEPDHVYLVPTPSSADAPGVRASEVKGWMEFAVENGYPYYDRFADAPDNNAGQAIGMFGDGTHLAVEGIAAYGLRFMEAAGLFRPWDNPRGEEEIVRTMALEVNGADPVEDIRQVASEEIERTRGLRFITPPNGGSVGYVATANALATPVGTQSFTLFTIVRVTQTGDVLFAGMSSVQGVSSNAGGALGLSLKAGNLFELVIRANDGSTGEAFRTPDTGTLLSDNRGKLMAVALRRDMSLTGKPVFSVFVPGQEFTFYPLGNDTMDQDLSGTDHVVSSMGNIYLSDLYGIGLTYTALSDDRIHAALRRMEIPEECDQVRWLFDEQQGITVRDTNGTNHGYIVPQLTGPASGHGGSKWINEDRFAPQPFIVTGDYSLYPQGDYVNDGGTSGDPNELTLPYPTAVGQRIRIANAGGRWKLECRANMSVLEGAGATTGTDVTTVGTSGYVQCDEDYDSIELCAVEVDTATPSYTWAIVGGAHTLSWT